MLNAEGWSRLGQRKQGTRMKNERPAEFLDKYRQRVESRLVDLRDRVESIGQSVGELPPHLVLQKRHLEDEIARRVQQIVSLEGV